MFGPEFMDDIDSGSFFDNMDQFDGLIDFPDDNSCTAEIVGEENSHSFPSVWPSQTDAFPSSNPIFIGSHGDDSSHLTAALAVPYEDILHMEWVSTFCSDSFSDASMEIEKENSSLKKKFHSSSPVSVLENSSDCSRGNGKTMPPPCLQTIPNPGRNVRARSKRPRPTSFNPRSAMQIISPTSFIEPPYPFLCPTIYPKPENNILEPQPLIKVSKAEVTGEEQSKKKRKIKLSLPLGPKMENDEEKASQEVRKCMHCEITKTPQWRAGPMGPKTLCNACGVRYKSGRLFPEYRPAASPTFVPSIHSNSHKKVVEMRSKVCEKSVMVRAPVKPEPVPETPLPDLIPNFGVFFD